MNPEESEKLCRCSGVGPRTHLCCTGVPLGPRSIRPRLEPSAALVQPGPAAGSALSGASPLTALPERLVARSFSILSSTPAGPQLCPGTGLSLDTPSGGAHSVEGSRAGLPRAQCSPLARLKAHDQPSRHSESRPRTATPTQQRCEQGDLCSLHPHALPALPFPPPAPHLRGGELQPPSPHL